MNTVTITANEYRRLAFLSRSKVNKQSLNQEFIPAGFGVLKKSFGKSSSIAAVNKMRRAWRA